MKSRKVTFSILLIITLLISTISSTFAFAADTVDYSGAVLRMKQLGILDTSVNDLSVVMTRGQFVKSVVIADNLIDDASGMEGATIFGDIASYSDLSGYVNILINKHLISGMPDGKFHPEAGITYSEFCTDLVRLLGYTDSDLIGTWPSNYLGKTKSLKISDNLSFKKNDKIAMGSAAVMFDRFLGTDVKTDSTNAASKVIFSDSINLYSDNAIYSKPQIAVGFNAVSDKLGDIAFDSNTKIIKNGQAITKIEIKNTDVVYSVTNRVSNYRYILVVENYIEGNITDLLADTDSLNSIVVDTQNYNFSDYMDLNSLSSFVKGDLVSIILDKDGKVLDVKNIENKTGTIAEYIIIGNSKTSDKLLENEILTDKGTLTLMKAVDSLEIGGKYKLYVSDNFITKIDKKENTTKNYVVKEKMGLDMNLKNDNNEINSMRLPKAAVYYYHGEKVNYNSAVTGIDVLSSIILSKNSNDNEYEYAVIIDPIYGAPKIYKSGDFEFWNEIQNSNSSFMYKNEVYTTDSFNISNLDVIYFVSDIWNKNHYIYNSDKKVKGFIESFAPSKINTNSITINNQIYELSRYFDKTKLNSYSTGSYIRLIIGMDGKVVDIISD